MKQEYILCAAIWYKHLPLITSIPQICPKNIEEGIVILGHRHGQCIWTVSCLTGLRTASIGDDVTGEHEQGFLTNTNRFVDRKEAAEIAYKAKQTDELLNILYSEDLY